MIHGILNLDKPKEWTSHDVVAKVRRIINQQKVGHAGSLDPNATGLLILCLGKGTKLSSYFMQQEKEYHAFFHFGVTTDSQDADGTIIQTREVGDLTEEKIIAAIPEFRGDIMQIPPMVSAVKVGGKRLYRLARKGKTVERAPRPVRVSRFDLVRYEEPVAEVRIACSKGTYVRTLAADIGEKLGCGAYLEGLSRLRIGDFQVGEAYSIDEVAEHAGNGEIDKLYIPLEKTIESLKTVTLRASTGRWDTPALPKTLGLLEPIDPVPVEGEFLKVQNRSGKVVGVVQVDGDAGQLRKVLI